MTGPERYAEAERLLRLADQAASVERASYCVASAQVHATLALAAATIATSAVDVNDRWHAVTS